VQRRNRDRTAVPQPTEDRCRAAGASRLQAIYYLTTGVWPIISMRTFEAVTGPKQDGWLVRMVGLLAAVIGAALLRSSPRPDPALAIGAPLAFAAVDMTYVARGGISRVYLGDAVVELAFAAAHLAAAKHRSRRG
jgi:hypothetical protein